jgi:DNA modification methylase
MVKDTIINGDAYKLIKEVPSKSIDLIVTDPPYEIGKSGVESKPTGIFKTRSETYVKEIAPFSKGIDYSILEEMLRVMKKCNIYIWCNKEQIYSYLDFFTKKHGFNFEMIIWAKSNVPPFTNGHYLKDKEYCLYFWERGVRLSISYDTGKTVYESNVNMKDKDLYGHPTIKPENIITNLISNSSVGGDSIVFDPFSGSGTTCCCAKKLGLHYLGFEISKKYWSVSMDRLKGITRYDREAMESGQERLF